MFTNYVVNIDHIDDLYTKYLENNLIFDFNPIIS